MDELSGVGRPSSRWGSHLISRLLPPALRFWLQTQVESIGQFDLHIGGSDQQILSGYVPTVTVLARQARYQGLCLSYAQLQAENIRINLGQVLRGKPLRLKQPFPVVGQIMIDEADFNASLTAPLLQQALQDFVQQLGRTQPASSALGIALAQVLAADRLTAEGAIAPQQVSLSLRPTLAPDSIEIIIQTDLTIENGRQLVLRQPRWLVNGTAQGLTGLDQFAIDLGPDVNLHTLRLDAGRLVLEGCINVVPVNPDG
ncbi:hypothetical protein XM38_050480 [Halomicronema hongdechloris C2206]|uniref:DUF2993 domain-containing protein n=1 Tax=Halomicronema hongdechloris C2206 TaxID=1641165 RepID=A0A1Z3HUU1_9CYAN|nr:DUF2993 domain-containing protein [Halomicronema hongdechloris]ASC74074.1 hypothetical protein XM38_050480 [Halomicronema hongdechloris C2206]